MPFEDFQLNKQLLTAVADAGYQNPTPIQEQAIPVLLGGHDLLGIAQTGTGKTAAFLLPLLMKVKYAQGMHPRALILAPTRELAIQISEHIALLAKHTDIRHTCVYGGLGPKIQKEAIAKGIDILVGTPGRVIDIYLSGELVLKEINTLIIDEADRMMDMGFMPQIRRMLEVIPSKKRQNMLFSATMPEKVLKLSEEFLEFPTRVEVTPQATTAEMVEQYVYHVPNFLTKINLLAYLLRSEEVTKAIIFTRSKSHADNIYQFISRSRKGFGEARVIHANKGQNARINSIHAFKEEDIRILVATDVAARGIDVTLVSHVINFDVPLLYEEYVHRVGRTGRALNRGTAITFCTPPEEYHLKKIERIIRMTVPVKPLPEEVPIEETAFDEQQEMAKSIDVQRRKEDPEYKGAFHEKQGKSDADSKRKATARRSGIKAAPIKSSSPKLKEEAPQTGRKAKSGGSKPATAKHAEKPKPGAKPGKFGGSGGFKSSGPKRGGGGRGK